ncbi:MAG: 6-pyruvoyl-tetrahydropterin synthase-related protein [bacterium]
MTEAARVSRRRRLAAAATLGMLVLPILVAVLRPGWIQSHEGLSYPIRQVELWRCWQDGLYSARWFPDLCHGQGYPFLSFYAPLVFYLAGLGQLLGLSAVASLKIPIVLGLLAGVAGMYRLTRLGTSRAGALVAAALFTFAPYRLRDLFIRGDLAELLAQSFLPWALWALLRLGQRRDVRHVAAVMIAGTLAILSHNILGMFTGLCLALAAVVAVLSSRERVATAIACGVAGIGTLAGSAFFWAPALHEKQFVQIDQLTTGHYELSRWFVPPLAFFGRGEFPGISQELPMTFELGWAQWLGILLLVALAIGTRAGRFTSPESPPPARRALVVLGLALLAGGLFLTTRAAAPVYAAFPLLTFVQFPWRLLAVATVGAALLGGLGADRLADVVAGRRGWALAAGLVLASTALAWPLVGPKPNGVLPAGVLEPTSLQATRNTTTAGEYLPREVTRIGRPRSFENGVRVEENTRVLAASRRAGRWSLRIESEAPARVTLVDLYYPGWVATANGRLLELGATDGTGNLWFEAPAGTTDVEVRLEPLPVRRGARILSGITWIALLLAVLGARIFGARSSGGRRRVVGRSTSTT